MSRRQTQMMQARLEARFPKDRFTLKTIRAHADLRPDVSLAAMGGEGVFVKELEHALLAGEIDCAVHSMKDLPLDTPEGLRVVAITEREDARDAFISRTGEPLERLPAGSRVGTSSLRRRSQILLERQDLELLDIRGNVDTRLRKLDEGRYDAIVLAAAGLIRLGLEERVTAYLSLERMLPEPGQGALGIEARRDDAAMCERLAALDDAPTRACVEAERAFLRALGGGCRVPIAAYAEPSNGRLELDGAVMSPDGLRCVRERLSGSSDTPEALGETLANRLIARGAKDLLSNNTSG